MFKEFPECPTSGISFNRCLKTRLTSSLSPANVWCLSIGACKKIQTRPPPRPCLEVLNATSDHDALNVAITNILTNNMLDLRTEIVQEMESGLCRNLLEPRAQQPKFMHQPLDNGESLWPMVLGTIFCPSMLVVAFIAGRQCSFGLLWMLFQLLWSFYITTMVPHRGPLKLRGV